MFLKAAKTNQGFYAMRKSLDFGGERGIRTLGTRFVGTHDFQSCAFDQLSHLSMINY